MFGTKEDFSFRDLHHKLLAVTNDPMYMPAILKTFPNEWGDNAALVYGYIDYEAGITFEVLSAARVVGTKLVACREAGRLAGFKLRYDAVKGLLLSVDDPLLTARFAGRIAAVNQIYRAPEIVEEMRKIERLDPSRNAQFPDDIQVLFFRQKSEIIWCRIAGFDGEHVTVTMLNEPYADFGVHEGDSVPIRLLPYENEYKAVAILPGSPWA